MFTDTRDEGGGGNSIDVYVAPTTTMGEEIFFVTGFEDEAAPLAE